MRTRLPSRLGAFVEREKPFFLIVPVAVAYLLTLNPNWKPGWDSAIYISLARSLIAGEGYTYMGYSHIKYPPVFPLLLTPIVGVFGDHYLLMRLMIVVTAICSIGAAYFICRPASSSASEPPSPSLEERHERPLATTTAASVMLLSGFSYPLLSEATYIESDFPYMFFSFLALGFIDRYSRRGTCLNGTACLTVAFILLAYFTRMIGAALIVAGIPYLFWRAKRESSSSASRSEWCSATRKAGFLGLVFLAFASAWLIRNQLVTNLFPPELAEGMSYERELILVDPDASDPTVAGWRDLISRVDGNWHYYQGLMAKVVSGGRVESGHGATVISLVVLCGALVRAIPNPGLVELYMFFYFWIVLLWPSRQDERFLVPVIPFLFLYLLCFARSVADLLGRAWTSRAKVEGKRGRGYPSIVALVASGLFLLNLFPAVDVIAREHRRPYYRGGDAYYIKAMLWVKENTPGNSVIATDRAPWAHLLTGRRAFTFPWTPDSRAVVDSMQKNGVTHVIWVPWGYSAAYLYPAITAHRNRFSELHRVGGSVIYRFHQPRGYRLRRSR